MFPKTQLYQFASHIKDVSVLLLIDIDYDILELI